MDDLQKLNNDFTVFGFTIPDPWATIISLALILIIGMIAIRLIVYVVRKALKRSSRIDDMLLTFFTNLTKVVCGIILIAICLDKLGVNIGTIVAVLGAAGAAIALALKDSLANVAGGLMIIITQPFKKGDLINVGEYQGRVQEIDLFLTTLRTLNYRTITIPNGLINTSILVNESREEIRRVDVEFGISYHSDIRKAMDIMKQVCADGPLLLDDPAPSMGVKSNDDSAVVLELFAWCRTDDYFDAGYYLKENVKLAFDENGIEIPFPQMDVRVTQG